MPRKPRNDGPGRTWHITGRVNWRLWHLAIDGAIPLFLRLLGSAVEEFSMTLWAYVFMSNHYHLVLQSPEGERFRTLTGRRARNRHFRPWPKRHYKSSVLAQCMRTTLRGVSTKLQHQLEISGHFWEERYDARLISDSWSLIVRIAYDHRNPVREGMVIRPEEYPWSSAGWWAGTGDSPVPLGTGKDLPFGLELGPLRQAILRYQASRQLDDAMKELRNSNRRWESPEGRTALQEALDAAGIHAGPPWDIVPAPHRH
ncbi:MAG: transposase [Planctomycetota bacterium]|jgi:REP element-mobilizing transposase RayT